MSCAVVRTPNGQMTADEMIESTFRNAAVSAGEVTLGVMNDRFAGS